MAQFEQLIAANKRNSVLLVVVFVLFICGLGGLLGWAIWGDPRAAVPSIAIALTVAVVTGLVGYYSGPQAVLALSRARPISKQDDPQLYNVVEELTLASGLPMPRLYVIDTPAMNAFATGRDPDHAHIAVTSGLRERLGRDQLQGVLAHELSHVQNYDTRFMTLMAVLVGVVVLLADIGLRSLFWGGGRRRSRGSGGGGGIIMLVILLAAIVLAIIAPIFAKLIQLAVSRQREYLADASGALIVRNPYGLSSALKKLGAYQGKLRTASAATAHMFIANPFGKDRGTSANLFASHPPLEDRIQRLEQLVLPTEPASR